MTRLVYLVAKSSCFIFRWAGEGIPILSNISSSVAMNASLGLYTSGSFLGFVGVVPTISNYITKYLMA